MYCVNVCVSMLIALEIVQNGVVCRNGIFMFPQAVLGCSYQPEQFTSRYDLDTNLITHVSTFPKTDPNVVVVGKRGSLYNGYSMTYIGSYTPAVNYNYDSMNELPITIGALDEIIRNGVVVASGNAYSHLNNQPISVEMLNACISSNSRQQSIMQAPQMLNQMTQPPIIQQPVMQAPLIQNPIINNPVTMHARK